MEGGPSSPLQLINLIHSNQLVPGETFQIQDRNVPLEFSSVEYTKHYDVTLSQAIRF